MERGKENEKGANNSSVSYAVLREDIVNLLDFIERLKNEEDQIALDMDQIEKLTLELTFMSSCLQLCYFILDGFDAEMSCISYEVHDLVQSLFHQSGDDLLVKLKDRVVPRILEIIKSSISSDHHFESSVSMTDDQLVELLDSLLVNLHYLPKYRATELIFQSITQYELLQNVCGNLRDFHRLKVNGCIERETIEYVLPQFQLMAERVGHFCFVLLADQLDVPQVNSMLAHLLVKIIPVELEVMHICSTNLKASKSAQVGRFIKQLLEPSPDILREYAMHLQAHLITVLSLQALQLETFMDHGLLNLIFLLPVTVKKIKHLKEEVPQKISKNRGLTIANSPNKLVESKSSEKLTGKVIVGFEEETIIRQLTSGPAELDVLSIIGMPGAEESSELLEKKVFGEESCPDELKYVGEEIAQKCEGLPLVLDPIGGVIATKEKEQALWLEVLHNLKSFKNEDEVMKVIQLSYDHLSNHLKPCLLYFASYPKDQDIEISELKDLWNADGLVEETEMKSAEEVLEVYVDELISSSLVYKVGDVDYCKPNHLSYSCHLRHLRLLIRLDLHGISLTDSLLNEIGMLVHLRFLSIWTEAKALPPSFSNLLNLETLVVYTGGSNIVLSPSIWSLAKLRHVRTDRCSVFDLYINESTVLEEDSKLENLRILYELQFSDFEDREDILKRFPNLRSLGFKIFEDSWNCSAIGFPRLDALNELEQVSATVIYVPFEEQTYQFDFHFPSSLNKLELSGFDLTSDSLSRIARLPNLQNLTLDGASIQGGKWNLEQVIFQNLKLILNIAIGSSEFMISHRWNFKRSTDLEKLKGREGKATLAQLVKTTYMDRGNENEGERKKGEGNNFSVSSYVIREDIFNLLDFIERLKNEEDQIDVDMDRIEKLKLELTYVSTFPLLSYSKLDSFNAKMSRKAERVFSLVQSVFYESGKHMLVKYDMDHVVHRLLENIDRYISSLGHPESSSTMIEEKLVELLDSLVINLRDLPNPCAELILPLMTQYDVVQHVCGNIRDFHGLKVNGCIEHEIVDYVLPQFQLMAERVGHFCSVLLAYQLDKIDELDDKLEVPQVISMLAHLLVEIIPVELEIMHICSTNFERSKSAEVGRLVKQLLETSPNILREYLIHLQAHMVTVLGASASARNIHVMIEFLLIILTDLSKDFIRQEKLFVLLARVGALTREVSILVRDLEEKSRSEENTDEIKCATLDLLENIELLKEELKHIYLKAPEDSSQHCFSKSDGPLFMNLLLRNLSDLFDSNAYSVALIKKEIGCVKEDLEFIRSFFGNVEQDLNRDLWTRVLDVAYEAEHAINSILARDHGLLQLIFLLPDTVEKIKHIKEEVLEKIPKNTGIVVVNSPKKPVESKSSIANKIIVGFEEEKEWIIRKLTSGPADVDVISIVGMPGLGKTTLADRVYNDKTVVDHFDVRAWCTIDQERNEKKLLQKIFNQVIGLKDTFSEDHIDDDVADKLRKLLFGMRYLIVLDDLWDTATWDELTRPFPEFQKRSRIILTSRKKEVALQGKHHRDPLYLRLLTLGESWELLEKRVFGEERCPDELLDVGEEIARKCDGLPLVLDLIGGVIARKEKTKTFWLEVLKNLNSFIFKDEEEVMKVIQLSYDHLSDHLKPCLIYLASYPKDERILISDLTDLWSAEGLVEQTGMEVGEESYPVLEKLYILNCHDLMEIPECFGDIASLKSITVLGNPQLKESALKVKEYVADMTGEDKLAVM
ncbi:putative late blight resistance protein -like r1b-17 [Nicotiana attenuata]|uniref:Late blight resistance protein -like r1b-17 n=1 Tax=Nicotiana attenuata TaxID=49451 RepID=A0A1J6I1N7_NICAT|nr:putative late blight resistance protein -like r1b-17 [Nicotiana attenuata]